jgi:hypothetical protein
MLSIARSLPLVLAAACATGTMSIADDAVDSGTSEPGTDASPTGGFELDAVVVDVLTGEVPSAALCVDLVDPSPSFLGEAPLVLASAAVGAAGGVTFGGVATESVVGLVLAVDDCGAEQAVYPSWTTIPAEAYAGLGDGDPLSGQTAYVVSATTLAALQASAEAAGSRVDLAASGWLVGFVVDASGAPLDGATVSCAGCERTWYLDGDGDDGLFTAGGLPNTATRAAAGGAYVVPAAPVGAFLLADDGGAHAFAPQRGGASAGVAAVAVLQAD